MVGGVIDVMPFSFKRKGYINTVHDPRKYHYKDNIFNKIDSEEKAYWLGYLYADGYNSQVENYISFTQVEQDKEMVYKFKKFLESNAPIQFRAKPKQNEKWQDVYTLKVTSKQISQDLAKIGCVQAKSLILKYPTILSDDLHKHFIRGYFDGDGSVQVNRWEIVGTYSFLDSVRDIFHKDLELNKTKIYEREGNKVVTLIYGGRLILEKIYSYLYDKATIFSPRKKENFTKYLQQQKDVVDKKQKFLRKRNSQILKLSETGVSYAEIAKQFDITGTRVSQILNSLRKNDRS